MLAMTLAHLIYVAGIAKDGFFMSLDNKLSKAGFVDYSFSLKKCPRMFNDLNQITPTAKLCEQFGLFNPDFENTIIIQNCYRIGNKSCAKNDL